METLCLKTPVGEITLFSIDDKIIALDWGRGMDAPRTSKCKVLNQAADALKTYFQTGQEDFASLPLDPGGTKFQARVWKQMQKIKPGRTKTYGQIAKTLKSSPRAVGGACGANPIPILIPCHRVMGANGKLAGYSGGSGIDTKTQLLRLEGTLD
ncbi:methylated-DNA--[protein]-cysteine S-methyltransferase [Pseudomonadota bacterium]